MLQAVPERDNQAERQTTVLMHEIDDLIGRLSQCEISLVGAVDRLIGSQPVMPPSNSTGDVSEDPNWFIGKLSDRCARMRVLVIAIETSLGRLNETV